MSPDRTLGHVKHSVPRGACPPVYLYGVNAHDTSPRSQTWKRVLSTHRPEALLQQGGSGRSQALSAVCGLLCAAASGGAWPHRQQGPWLEAGSLPRAPVLIRLSTPG